MLSIKIQGSNHYGIKWRNLTTKNLLSGKLALNNERSRENLSNSYIYPVITQLLFNERKRCQYNKTAGGEQQTI
jgi:hypothetical protein